MRTRQLIPILMLACQSREPHMSAEPLSRMTETDSVNDDDDSALTEPSAGPEGGAQSFSSTETDSGEPAPPVVDLPRVVVKRLEFDSCETLATREAAFLTAEGSAASDAQRVYGLIIPEPNGASFVGGAAYGYSSEAIRVDEETCARRSQGTGNTDCEYRDETPDNFRWGIVSLGIKPHPEHILVTCDTNGTATDIVVTYSVLE